MQIIVTIPDEFAAQVQARGLSPATYIEQWVAGQMVSSPLETSRNLKLEELEVFFAEIAADSDQMPQLPDTAFTRESFYQDHD